MSAIPKGGLVAVTGSAGFIGGWMVRDSRKLLINKILVALPLIITYLIGPLGVFIYWLIRIFYAKSISLYD